ncbi:NAD(+) synthase [Candidatus Peregrinibacteria bacterium]|jgi:NAD+ synthetase|nr:NAD(+) synthase [Candidatus Peregrinibacteria bacterium]MBT4631742.1 NAD(+) synthase [Candidatus Peregrinibacteria bacterium]MBT5517248.1 NAD(+) synthase [Candidatus Peregrinibacteria bacterium]MBT5824533.1 NAD(+) synthase [Candidatus Peregrinibacteria bacterium]
MQAIYSTFIKELHQFAKNRQYQRAVLALSGGVDSALALCVASRALGAKNVTALILPEIGLTSNEDIEHAKALADHFGCESHYQPINNFLVDYSFVAWEKTEAANESLKAHIRATLLHHYSIAQNALIIGSANKSDLTIGYGTLEGEFAGEIQLFADVYKTELVELATLIGLPKELIEKDYSRGLRPHQSDIGDLGAPWAQIDEILQQLEDKVDPETMIQKGMDALLVHKINRLVQQNQGKYDHLQKIQIGRISEAIKRAQAAEEASSLT